jgi:hypothetical protein
MLSKRNWYSRLTSNPDDLSPIADAYDYYMEQYEDGVQESNALVKRGERMDEASTRLPGISAYRFAQLQEIEQIIGFLENREKRLLGAKRRAFREHYNRELTDSMVEKYAETDPDVLDMAEIRNMFALARNKFLALTKQHEYLHFQLTNLTKLREKGIEGTLL